MLKEYGWGELADNFPISFIVGWLILMMVILILAGWIYMILFKRRSIKLTPELHTLNNYSPSLLSVVIPARNSANTLPRCVESLLSQEGINYELILVDDNSNDSTTEVIWDYATKGIKAISIKGLPKGWTGKTWACYSGFLASSGDWILFTDADTEFNPVTLTSALSYCYDKDLDILTLIPRIECYTFPAKIVNPIMTHYFYVLAPPYKVNEQKASFIFGSFFMVKRRSYMMLNGHSSVKDAIVEDKAIGELAREKGLKIGIARGDKLFGAVWNDSLSSVWNGLRRVFHVTLGKDLSKAVKYAIATFMLYVFPLIASVIAISFQTEHLLKVLIILLSTFNVCLTLFTHASDMARNGVNRIYALFYPISSLIISTALIKSSIDARKNKELEWKGRIYREFYR